MISPAMPVEWSESDAPADEVVLVFDAIDQDEQDRLDVDNFARGVQAPSREDPGGKAFATSRRQRNRAMTPADMLRVSLGLVVALVVWGTLSELRASDGVIIFAVFGGFLAGSAVPGLVNLFRAQKAAPVARSVDERFTLRVGPGRFTLAGARRPDVHLDLASIERFHGDQRLSIALADGSKVLLPCKLRSKAHAPLAQRLNELLQRARAASSGYRDAR